MPTPEARPATPEPTEPRPARILPLRLVDVCLEIGGERRLDGISCEIAPGPCSVILGANGAGKSLTLRVAHGLLAPTRGQVLWQGPGAGDTAREQAMVLQRPVLLRRSVRANLDYALRLRGHDAQARARRIEATLERTGLAPFADRPARRLSVGEQQRVALARAWCVEPQVLWLDEPAAALDPTATRTLEETLRTIRASGTKVVMTTHDLHQARRLADEILFLHRGRLLEQTPAEQFFDEPRSDAARAFLKGELPA